jgi:hypothetical protein
MQSSKRAGPEAIVKQSVPPKLNIKKIGIVSRNYRCKFPNGRRDFSYALPEVLKLGELGIALPASLPPPVLDRDGAILDPTEFVQSLNQ